MRAVSIDTINWDTQELDINLQANTIYTFFSSILVDEINTLQKHTVYTDANALSLSKPAFFLGEQLLVGDALIIGRNELEEVDATIPEHELKEIINTEIPQFYQDVLILLSQTDINLYRTFEVDARGEKLLLNTEWVLYTFNIADARTQEYFINELQKVIDTKEDVETYMQKMAQLAINAAS